MWTESEIDTLREAKTICRRRRDECLLDVTHDFWNGVVEQLESAIGVALRQSNRAKAQEVQQ